MAVRRNTPAPRRRAALALTTSTLLALAACAGSGASDDDGGDRGSEDVAACVEEATASVEAAKAPMQIADLTPFDASQVEGDTFMMVQLSGKSETSTANAKGFADAMESVGATGLKFDGKGTPDVIAQGFQSAIAQEVDGIVTDGFDPSLVPASVEAAQEAGIPVVAAHVGVGGEKTDGVVAAVSVNNVKYGRLQADYALATSDCDVDALVFFTTAGKGTVHNADGLEERLEELCPDDCSLERVDVNAATYVTSMAGQVQTTLQRNPDTNFLITTADFWTPYMIQGSKAVGREVPMIGGAQGEWLGESIKGNGVVANLLWPPGEVPGWYEADALMRAAAGEPKDQEMPVRLVDASNWGTDAGFEAQFPELADYQDVFKKAWGVS